MDKTKEEFVHFIRNAIDDTKSDSFAELYNFLLACFIRADSNFCGKVSIVEFDTMIEEAAALPRKYGFAPRASDMYKNILIRSASREQLFRDMNLRHDGYITLDEWISFSVSHIMGKVKTLGQNHLTGDCSKEEFIVFIKKACNRSSPEFRELFFYLLRCFTGADRDRDGAVNHKEFDSMIEAAARAPRRHGLAPLSRIMFSTDAERLAARAQYFKAMDTKNYGTISLDEWLKYAMDHIIDKVAALP